ncbi:MAG: radical SAM protein [Bdellovibrionales bacterium]|jgi:radical SAM superfamily enzyme YgiQ (UPF0313 family)|nr:radical SAM protein [Bdellovibrionales bacterium]
MKNTVVQATDPSSKYSDFVLCTVPISNPDSPLIGASLLSAILKKNGHTSTVIDLNIIFNSVYMNYYDEPWISLEATFADTVLFQEYLFKIDDLVESWVEQILSVRPKFVGFSAFTYGNSAMIYEISRRIRASSNSVKIIVGGSYCEYIGKDMYDKKLVDFYVVGHGEEAILKIANGDALGFQGINGGRAKSVSFTDLPHPDYTDLDLKKYSRTMNIAGSRGCPWECTFCSVTTKWPKYVLREPDDIVSELANHIIVNQIYSFYFIDSLMNGSMGHLRKLCSLLSSLRSKVEHEFEWQTFFLVRGQRVMVPEDFDLVVKSNCKLVKIGIESGSSSVRDHMKKNFDTADLFYFMDQMIRVGLHCDLLFITGYPTETEEDFEQTKQLLLSLKRYQSIIEHVRVAPIYINFEIPLWEMRNELNIQYDNNGGWFNQLSSSSIAAARYIELRDFVFSHGYKIRGREDERMKMVNLRKKRT